MGIKKIDKILYGGRWDIAYRHKGLQEEYSICKSPQGEYCADPFILDVNGVDYIFCEQYRMDRRKGCIGYFQFIDGVPVNKGIIIEKPYHLSYPCVFNYQDVIYMIPESSENKTVELYKAVEFPYRWEFKHVLLAGQSYVDTTVITNEDEIHFLTYHCLGDGYVLEKYALADNLLSANKITEKFFAMNTGRGAGAVYYDLSGSRIRPSQNCIRNYGESIIFNRVIRDDELYEEETIEKLTKCDVKISQSKNVVGIHTFASNEKYEVIDLFTRRLDCTFTLGNIIAKRLRKRRLLKK
jgi:hypothetical protein